MRIGLVGDAGPTGDAPAPARELFVSPVFRAAAAYAEREYDCWLVLDVGYGLVAPDVVLRPGRPSLVPERYLRERWAYRVTRQILALFAPGVEVGGSRTALEGLAFSFHAGARYREFLTGYLACYGATVEAPLAGLKGGQQLAWYATRRATQLDEAVVRVSVSLRKTAAAVATAVAVLAIVAALTTREDAETGGRARMATTAILACPGSTCDGLRVSA